MLQSKETKKVFLPGNIVGPEERLPIELLEELTSSILHLKVMLVITFIDTAHTRAHRRTKRRSRSWRENCAVC